MILELLIIGISAAAAVAAVVRVLFVLDRHRTCGRLEDASYDKVAPRVADHLPYYQLPERSDS